jgi:hypothetical protein
MRIQNIGSFFDTTHLILRDFKEVFHDTKEEREEINTRLRDILARNESLRRKDFNSMMNGILTSQDSREKEVKTLFRDYLNEQTEMVQVLRDSLENFKGSIARGELDSIRELQGMVKEVIAKQDERKEEVTSKLKEFQREESVLASGLKCLLEKGRELRIKDLKLMLKEFKVQHQDRVVLQKERREEVNNMLAGFKKDRLKVAKDRQSVRQSRHSPKNCGGATQQSIVVGTAADELPEEGVEK